MIKMSQLIYFSLPLKVALSPLFIWVLELGKRVLALSIVTGMLTKLEESM
jgi:hypothetical protein